MANTEAKNYTCQVVGLIIASIIVGVLSYYVGLFAPLWVAIIAFLILLALGSVAVSKFCGMKVEDAPSAIIEPKVEPTVEVKTEVPAATESVVNATEPEVEVSSAGEETPELLVEPRGGSGDDLKKIKGVGPKLEADLNAKGVWHYSQIANWTAEEVVWADEHLVKFKGRVSRDDWVGQAKTLAAGGAI